MMMKNLYINVQNATFAGGCFWCTEAIFKQIKGVMRVISGYSGGSMINPSYEKVAKGTTNHAEAIQITFDPKIISYSDLLYIFFKTHDPTTPNQQGSDIGTQYRSVIFYHDQEQKKSAKEMITKLNQDKAFERPIITEILPYNKFWPAEGYHQNYYESNPDKAYCRLVIDPKIEKLKTNFKKYLKK